MKNEHFRDYLFNLLNESDEFVDISGREIIQDIEVDERQHSMAILTRDGSVFELTCENVSMERWLELKRRGAEWFFIVPEK